MKDNELIAEFMGAEPFGNGGSVGKMYKFKITDGEEYFKDADDLDYHWSWDWLMPVVEKIEFEIGASVWIRKFICEINFADEHLKFKGGELQLTFSTTQEEKPKILAVYKAVVEFIKFLNTQNN